MDSDTLTEALLALREQAGSDLEYEAAVGHLLAALGDDE